MTYSLELIGKIPSKKNMLRPRFGSGGKGIRISTGAREQLDRLEMQIPAELRDLGLVHPDMVVQFMMPEGRSDRDNMLVTLLDFLVKYGVIKNDSVASFNGQIVLFPAIPAEDYITKITFAPNPRNGWKPPKRKKL